MALTRARLQAEPGNAVQTRITLQHTGRLVESYRLDVVGLEPGWWQVDPPELELRPGTSGEAVVELRPPAGVEAPDGALPFGVRAVSTLDPGRSVVEEGDLEVGRVLELQSEIVPVSSRARWTGRHVLRFTNWGNTAVQLRLRAEEQDTRLAFLLEPATLTIPVGGTATARLKARIRHPVLRGAPARLPFRVIGEQPGVPAPRGLMAAVPDPGRPVLDAAVEQRPVLTRGVVMALVLALVAAGALVGLLLRGSSVDGARKADVAPAAPANLRLLGYTDKGASLTWPATTDLAGHRVAQWVRKAPGSDVGTAAGWQEAKPGERVLLYQLPDGLKPDTEYCFVAQAVRSGLYSASTKQLCSKSPQGDLAPPEGFAVEQPKKDAPRAVATWEAVDGIRYEVLGWDLGPPGVDERVRLGPVEGATTSLDLRPGVNCFVLRALRGSQTSKLTAPECVTFETQTEPGPNTGQGGGGNGSTGGPNSSPDSPGRPGATLTWVSLVSVSPASVTNAQGIATTARNALRRFGFDARTIHTTEEPYPGLPTVDAWVVVVVPKGAPSQRAAATTCTQVVARGYPCQASNLSVPLAQPTPGATGSPTGSATQAAA